MKPGRIIATPLVLAGALLLAGCSTLRLAYTQASTLIHWWVDGYLDLDAAQGTALREASERWLVWHRSRQLPEVAATLREAGLAWRSEAPLSPAQVCHWSAQARRWADAGLAQALPDLARLATRLQPAQLQHLADRQARQAREFADEVLDQPVARQRERALTRLTERYERLLGPLTATQTQWLTETVAATDEPARWAAEQARRRADLHDSLQQLLQARDAPAAAQARLQALAQRWRAGPPDTQAWLQRTEQAHCALLARLHGSATPRQKAQGADQLARWEQDARSLVQEAVAAVAGSGP